MKNIICSVCVMVLMSFAPFKVYSTGLLHESVFSSDDHGNQESFAKGLNGNATNVDPKPEVWTAELIGEFDDSPKNISSDGKYLFHRTFEGFDDSFGNISSDGKHILHQTSEEAKIKYQRFDGSKWEDVRKEDAPKLFNFIIYRDCPPPHDFSEPSGVFIPHHSPKSSNYINLSCSVGENMYKVVGDRLMVLDGKEWRPIEIPIPFCRPTSRSVVRIEDLFSVGKNVYVTVSENYDDGCAPAPFADFPCFLHVVKFNDETRTWTPVAHPLSRGSGSPTGRKRALLDKRGNAFVSCGGQLMKINGSTADWSDINIKIQPTVVKQQQLSWKQETRYEIANGDLYAILSNGSHLPEERQLLEGQEIRYEIANGDLYAIISQSRQSRRFAVYKCIPPSTPPSGSGSSSSADDGSN